MRVEYSAPAECPTQQAFEAELAGHLGTETFAQFDELARTLSVDIEPDPAGFRARVELVDRRGQVVERGISAPTCEQAMRAIALVAALAARSQIEEAEREREAKALPNAAAAGEPSPPPSAGAPAALAPESPASPPSEPSGQAGRGASAPLGFGASVGAAVSTGVGPGAAPGLLAQFRVAFTGATERSLVLSAFGYDTFQKSLDVADVRFSLWKGRLELCPVEPRLSEGVFVSPCAGFELGSQTGRSYADGDRVEVPHEKSALWAAMTLAVRLRLRVSALELGVGPELGVPLFRNGFALVEPDRPVYQVPWVTVGASASAGLAW